GTPRPKCRRCTRAWRTDARSVREGASRAPGAPGAPFRYAAVPGSRAGPEPRTPRQRPSPGRPTMPVKGDPEAIQHPDGRVELRDHASIETSPLYNRDLAPVPLARRDWTTYNYAALWISMAHCIPTYMLASGLMASGMGWKQALVTILLGNTVVLIPIRLNSHPGTNYGIPTPVFA